MVTVSVSHRPEAAPVSPGSEHLEPMSTHVKGSTSQGSSPGGNHRTTPRHAFNSRRLNHLQASHQVERLSQVWAGSTEKTSCCFLSSPVPGLKQHSSDWEPFCRPSTLPSWAFYHNHSKNICVSPPKCFKYNSALPVALSDHSCEGYTRGTQHLCFHTWDSARLEVLEPASAKVRLALSRDPQPSNCSARADIWRPDPPLKSRQNWANVPAWEHVAVSGGRV